MKSKHWIVALLLVLAGCTQKLPSAPEAVETAGVGACAVGYNLRDIGNNSYCCKAGAGNLACILNLRAFIDPAGTGCPRRGDTKTVDGETIMEQGPCGTNCGGGSGVITTYIKKTKHHYYCTGWGVNRKWVHLCDSWVIQRFKCKPGESKECETGDGTFTPPGSEFAGGSSGNSGCQIPSGSAIKVLDFGPSENADDVERARAEFYEDYRLYKRQTCDAQKQQP